MGTTKLSCRLLAAIIIVLLAVSLVSCGNKGSSKRSGGIAGTGTGSGTGTGTGPNGTGSGTGTGTGTSAGKVWDINVLIKAKQNASGMEAFAEHMRSCHVGLYKSTEGQGMLGDMILRSGVSHTDEKVIFEPLGWGVGMSHKTSGLIYLDSQRPAEHVFLHEWGHSFLGVHGEEYECSGCNMARFVPDRLNREYCDSSNCITGGMECWDVRILPMFAGWTHTGTDPGNPPACNITIEN